MTTQTDTSPRPTRQTLEFALGELTGAVRSHQDEIGRLRTEQDRVPERVALALTPRLLALESTQEDHGRRLLSLERTKWVMEGGRVVLVFLVASVLIPLSTFLPIGPNHHG